MMLISKFDTTDIENRVAEFERENGLGFPAQYRAFMLRYNGGETPKTKLRFGRKSYVLRALFGIDAEQYPLGRCYTRNTSDECIGRGFLPVGADVFGNYFAIGIDEEKYGRMYFLDHERNFVGALLCDSFGEFIAAGKSEKIGHIPTIEERKQILKNNGNLHLFNPQMLAGWQAEIDRYKDIKQEEVII